MHAKRGPGFTPTGNVLLVVEVEDLERRAEEGEDAREGAEVDADLRGRRAAEGKARYFAVGHCNVVPRVDWCDFSPV